MNLKMGSSILRQYLEPIRHSFIVPLCSPEYSQGVNAFGTKNYELALTWLKPLAETGHPNAQYYVAWMCENGLGVAIDHREAARWYRLAAEHGDTFSRTRLGYLYEKGLGVARDHALAAQWYGKAADAGDRQGHV